MVVALVVDLLGLRQQRLDPLAQLDQRVALVGLLDDPGDQLADPVLVLVEHHLPFGLADPLQDHLLGGLGGDPAEVFGGDVAGRDLVLVGGDHLRVELGVLGLAQLARLGVDLALLLLLGLGRLGQQLLLQLGRQDQLEDAEVAGLVVEVDAGVFGGAGGLLVGGEEGVLERVHQLVGGDPLLLLERLDCVDDLFGHWGLLDFGCGGWRGCTSGPARRPRASSRRSRWLRCLVTRSQSARSTPSGWSMKRRSDFVAGLLDGDQVELRVELGQLLLDVLLGGLSCWVSGRKKSGPGPLLDTDRDRKA